MGRHINLDGLAPVFRGSDAVRYGVLSRKQLRGPAVRRYDGGWREGELWALNRDRERLNRVQAAGWEVVFVTAALLRDPERMVHTVRAALARRV